MLQIKKILSVLFLFVLCTMGFATSIKNYVCVVKGNISQEDKTFLQEYKNRLSNSSYAKYAEYVDAFLAGSFGSGFVYYSQEGRPYIVTNRHVVDGYSSVNLVFENEDGSNLEFKDREIIAVAEDLDLAIIGLPEQFSRPGLSLWTGKITDGDTVWSAGFPGLGNRPLWQLGSGIISNASVYMEEVVDPEVSSLIQHTAQIDGGNSGGPLLVKDETSAVGYKVVGVNTWQALNRQNTNYAIPASQIDSFILKAKTQTQDTSFDTQLSKFITNMGKNNGSGFFNITAFISSSMVYALGEGAFREVLARAPESVRAAVIASFINNPLDGLQAAVSYQVWKEFYLEGESFMRPTISEPLDQPTGKTVDYSFENEKTVSSFWIQEEDQWKLAEFSSIKESKQEEKQAKKKKIYFDFENPYFFSVSGGYVRGLTYPFNGFNLDFGLYYNFIGLNVFVEKERLIVETQDFSVDESFFLCGAAPQLQLPMIVGDFLIDIILQGRLGIYFPEDLAESSISLLNFGFGTGVNLGYYTRDYISPYLTIRYNYTVFTLQDFLLNKKEKVGNHSFSIGLGLKILEV